MTPAQLCFVPRLFQEDRLESPIIESGVKLSLSRFPLFIRAEEDKALITARAGRKFKDRELLPTSREESYREGSDGKLTAFSILIHFLFSNCNFPLTPTRYANDYHEISVRKTFDITVRDSLGHIPSQSRYLHIELDSLRF